MELLPKQPTGFFLSESGLEEWLPVSSISGKIPAKRLTIGSVSAVLKATSTAVESSLSVRRFTVSGIARGKLCLLAHGYSFRSRRAYVSKETLYDAADQLGDDEADRIAALLDLEPNSTERLFEDNAFLLVSGWEARTLKIAAEVLAAVCEQLKLTTVALDSGPPQFDDPPRPDDPADHHQQYRTALAASVPRAGRVAVQMGRKLLDVILYSKDFPRTFDEQLAALAVRTGIVKRIESERGRKS